MLEAGARLRFQNLESNNVFTLSENELSESAQGVSKNVFKALRLLS